MTTPQNDRSDWTEGRGIYISGNPLHEALGVLGQADIYGWSWCTGTHEWGLIPMVSVEVWEEAVRVLRRTGYKVDTYSSELGRQEVPLEVAS